MEIPKILLEAKKLKKEISKERMKPEEKTQVDKIAKIL